ncbi:MULTISPECIES: MFS transporter [unclassified Amycolatopsis]|uniref:MFS transporter n=1 Tax=unclassified Amycolatopsis TaxID=2618356 RepID=UPI001C69E351|nr:MFS transporter [Amycolatopsis sp. DSM 110486]QYN25642.1 MFS transporter [Amycolatopsis sp. DSM 110486]
MGVLASRRFAVFFGARMVSLLGSSMTPVALAFAVLDASPDSGDLGIVLASNMVPMLALLLVGGSVADRFPRDLVLRLANLGSGATQLVAAGVLLTGNYSLPFLVCTEFANGVLTAFTTPALRGIVPQLVDRGLLRQANSLLSSARNISKVAGPSVAGVLVATVGGGWAIAADGLSFVVAGLAFSFLRLPPVVGSSRAGVLRGIREGWHAFRRITWLWQIVAAFTVVNIAQTGVWQVLGPTIARATIGEASWGAVLSVRAAGVLITGVVMYRVAARRLLSLGQVCAALSATPLIVLGTSPGFVALAAAALVAGLGGGVANVAWDTTVQENVPDHLLSRMAAYDDFGSYVGIPIGQLSAGPLASAFGAGPVATAGGVVLAVAALVPLLSPVVRKMRHTPAEAGSSAGGGG